MLSSFFALSNLVNLLIHRVLDWATTGRAWLLEVPKRWQGMMSSDQVAIALSCSIGDLGHVKSSLKPQLKIIGMSHIASASGYNVSLMLDSLGVLLSPFWGWSKLGLQLVIIWGYVCLVGWAPSVTRAGLMSSVAVVARVLGRPNSSLRSLGLTVVILLVIQPAWRDNLGFQLSALATLASVLPWHVKNCPNELAWFQHCLQWGGRSLRQTVIVLVVTWPVIMDVNGSWPLVALLANPVYAVLAPMIAQLGVWYLATTWFLGLLSERLEIGLFWLWWLGLPLRLLTGLFVTVTNWFGDVRLGAIGWAGWSTWHSLVWYVSCFFLYRAWMNWRSSRAKIWVFYG